ncbi:MAG: protein translocase subunit SecD [Thermoguttaceae bacterium]|jgi:SecD/SecF fusion protein|nr:protein translocase subunit SecD [Thermoguttaceae bacterium]
MTVPIYAQLLIALAVVVFSMMLGSYLARRFRMPDYGWRISLVLLTLGIGAVVTVFGWPPKLGIDLRGGVILVYEVDQDKKGEEAVEMDKLVAAVSRRVNPGGQKEVTVRTFGTEQIEIIVPEADEAELRRLKDILQRIGTLEFRIVGNDRDHNALFKMADDAGPDARMLTDPDGNRLAWWVPVHESAVQEFAQGAGLKRRVRTVRGEEVLEVLVISDPFNVTGGFLRRAQPDVDQRGRPSVRFLFDSRGGRRFGRLTGNNVPDPSGFARRLGIILDGYLYSAPNIKSAIFDQGVIEGSFTRQDVEALVSVLQAGSLPTALTEEPISEMLIGPTLGRDTIRRGSISIGLAMILVLAFMLVYYRFAGVVACGALLANVLLVLAVMITIRAAFTLPGLAGLVLTVGMAVDANVLIFERIREELGRGAALRMAIRNGFSRATTTIVDANLTTLITATILYAVGTDQIRGFAITLWLGVVLSMFTAIFCARVVFDVAEKRRWISDLKMMRILGGTNIDFLGMRRLAGACSLLVIVLGLLGVYSRGEGLLDIDFTGGVSVETVFVEPQRTADIRTALSGLPDLAVSDVQYEGERPGTRFVVNTSQQNVVDPDTGRILEYATDIVERHIHGRFGEALATNSMAFRDLGTIEAPEDQPEPARPVERPTGVKPAEPALPEPAPAEVPAEPEAPTLPAPAEESPAEPAPAEEPPAEPMEPAASPPEEPPADAKEPEAPAEPGEPKPAEEEPSAEPMEPSDAPEPADKADSADSKDSADPLAPADPAESTEPEEESSDPAPQSSRRTDLPNDWLLASADAAALNLIPLLTAADDPIEDASQEPGPEVDEAAGADAATAAPPVGSEFVGGTSAVLQLVQPVAHDTLEARLREQLQKMGRDPDAVPLRLTNRQYEPGDSRPFNTWNLEIGLPAAEAESVLAAVDGQFRSQPYFPSSNTIGGKVAGDTRVRAVYALLFSLACILGYIWLRFQRVVYGLAAVVALVHDILITLGIIALSAFVSDALAFLLIDPFKIGLTVLAAFLTIIGYSLNDTIVVFDRIREVRGKAPQLTAAMVNASINQTLSRTLLTSLTTLIVVVILYVGGGQGIHAFAFALVVGVLVGTYSSIFIASPFLYWMIGSEKKA